MQQNKIFIYRYLKNYENYIQNNCMKPGAQVYVIQMHEFKFLYIWMTKHEIFNVRSLETEIYFLNSPVDLIWYIQRFFLKLKMNCAVYCLLFSISLWVKDAFLMTGRDRLWYQYMYLTRHRQVGQNTPEDIVSQAMLDWRKT